MKKRIFKLLSIFILLIFTINTVLPGSVYAQTLNLPSIGQMVMPTNSFSPLMIKGIKIFPNNPLKFDFIVDTGDSGLTKDDLKPESEKLIKYFLASLTTPEKDVWVNLSPYEQDRIIPKSFGQTEMGRDLLAQDYILKQLTASLMYPEDDLGEEFWDQIFEKAYELYGTTDVPINTFNKVWIIPEKAVVYENGDTAYIVESKLKVMLEEDYLALDKNFNNKKFGMDSLQDDDVKKLSNLSSSVVRDVILPAIEKEVNEGKHFSQLRQIYHSMILATWFKQNLKESILGQIYVDQNKIAGTDIKNVGASGRSPVEDIYEQYVEAFKKGVYDYIRDDFEPATQTIISRKYFSGGTIFKITDTMKVVQDISHSNVLISSKASLRFHIPTVASPVVEDRAQKTESSVVEEYSEIVSTILGALENPYIYESPNELFRKNKYIDTTQKKFFPDDFNFLSFFQEIIKKSFPDNILLENSQKFLQEVVLQNTLFEVGGSIAYLHDQEGDIYWPGIGDLDFYFYFPDKYLDYFKNSKIGNDYFKVLNSNLTAEFKKIGINNRVHLHRQFISSLNAETGYLGANSRIYSPFRKYFAYNQTVLYDSLDKLQEKKSDLRGNKLREYFNIFKSTRASGKPIKRLIELAYFRGDEQERIKAINFLIEVRELLQENEFLSDKAFNKKYAELSSNAELWLDEEMGDITDLVKDYESKAAASPIYEVAKLKDTLKPINSDGTKRRNQDFVITDARLGLIAVLDGVGKGIYSDMASMMAGREFKKIIENGIRSVQTKEEAIALVQDAVMAAERVILKLKEGKLNDVRKGLREKGLADDVIDELLGLLKKGFKKQENIEKINELKISINLKKKIISLHEIKAIKAELDGIKQTLTTFSGGIIWTDQDGEAVFFGVNVGDSRLYVRGANGKAEQMSQDDSVLERAIRNKVPINALRKNGINMEGLSDSLGSSERKEFEPHQIIEYSLGKLEEASKEKIRFFALSDGVMGNIADYMIIKIIEEANTSEEAVNRLVENSKESKKKLDDITVGVVEAKFIQTASPLNNTQQIQSAPTVKASHTKGGIDFDSGNLDLQTTGEGIDFSVPIDPKLLEELTSSPIQGFTPIILQIIPVTNLPAFLGLNDSPQEENDHDFSKHDSYYLKQESEV